MLTLLLLTTLLQQPDPVITCIVTDATRLHATRVVCDAGDRQPFTVDFSDFPEWHLREVVHERGTTNERVEIVLDPLPQVGQVLKRTYSGIALPPCHVRKQRKLMAYQVSHPGQIAPLSYHNLPDDCGELSKFLKAELRKVVK